jgi:hypothetical protein
MAPQGVAASLWQSDDIQSSGSSFIENGTTMRWTYQTTLGSGGDGMAMTSLLETTLEMAITGAYTVACSIIDERGVGQASALYQTTGAPSLWGSLVWGTGSWLGQVQGLRPRRIDWPNVVVYNKMQFSAQGVSQSGLRIGTLAVKEERLGYLQEYA